MGPGTENELKKFDTIEGLAAAVHALGRTVCEQLRAFGVTDEDKLNVFSSLEKYFLPIKNAKINVDALSVCVSVLDQIIDETTDEGQNEALTGFKRRFAIAQQNLSELHDDTLFEEIEISRSNQALIFLRDPSHLKAFAEISSYLNTSIVQLKDFFQKEIYPLAEHMNSLKNDEHGNKYGIEDKQLIESNLGKIVAPEFAKYLAAYFEMQVASKLELVDALVDLIDIAYERESEKISNWARLNPEVDRVSLESLNDCCQTINFFMYDVAIVAAATAYLGKCDIDELIKEASEDFPRLIRKREVGEVDKDKKEEFYESLATRTLGMFMEGVKLMDRHPVVLQSLSLEGLDPDRL